MFHATEQTILNVDVNVTPAFFAGTIALAIVLNVSMIGYIKDVQFPTVKSSSVDTNALYYVLTIRHVKKSVIKSVLIKSAKKICSYMCESCREPCTWSCPHFQCTKTCSEICDRPLCNEPCLKSLKFGHSCIGICGEPCPTLCRVCNKGKVTERRFGTETNPKSRFVQLSDCGDVLEVTSMERWKQKQMLQGDLSEIRFPVCPVCRTPIRNSVRYQRELNKIRRAVRLVKSKLSDSGKEKFEIDNVISKIKVLESLFNLNSKVGLEKQISETFTKCVDTFKTWISRQQDILTPQQQLDIKDELTRMQLMLKLIHVRVKNVQGDAQMSWNLHKAISSARTDTYFAKFNGSMAPALGAKSEYKALTSDLCS
ncbi:hypothetical protein CHS0354_015172 [Potamilus streckersoni]|uniref:Uncharacterized protein n=1 Tax=Potamilus streckersoni TaxID=2493646 RepID=A0AAE0SDG8_9BIVA|nr:hypothetical protein CHS0354_015172 [Potamilus streckersoni]